MKVSEITVAELKEYVKSDDDANIGTFLSAAKAYVKSYTGLTDAEVDTHEDIVPVIYVLVADMHDNRQFVVENDKVNVVAKSTLDMYCKNLL